MNKIIGADTVRLAGLQIDSLQKVRNGQITLEHWEWFNNLTKEERDEFGNKAQVDTRFKLVETFEIVVPTGYDHATRLTTFKAAHRAEFDCYNRIKSSKMTPRGSLIHHLK